jgi:hypothetical protein
MTKDAPAAGKKGRFILVSFHELVLQETNNGLSHGQANGWHGFDLLVGLKVES